ncbi:MAG: DUF1361 domain-containing protein [Algibacter sp.]
MNTIKQLLFNRFRTLSLLTVAMSLSMVLLMIRMKLTHSFFFLFLVWNLFLAVIPFAITTYLASVPKLNTYIMFLWFGIWLLFLPNAPYIITDLLHLRISDTSLLWLDVLVINAFALNGLILFYYSLLEMKTILSQYLNDKKLRLLIITIPFISGFGVYLGRFLRYNSWELLSNPKYLFVDILNIVVQPFENKEAWLFTLLFGAFLSIGFWMFQTFINSKQN